MRRLTYLMTIALVVVAVTPAFAQTAKRSHDFATDFTTIPVVANNPGAFGTFQTYVAILNPTASAFTISASLYDSNGTKHDGQIQLAAGEQKVYTNFVDSVFQFAGGGAVTLTAPDSAGGQRNNRFIVTSEVRSSGAHYGTSVPTIEFAGSNSRSYVPGITVDSTTRTNVGCFNQSDVQNAIKVTILDASGAQTLGSADLTLPAHAWGQRGVSTIVSGGMVRFDPAENAVCYAVVVDNATQDGRLGTAAEYRP